MSVFQISKVLLLIDAIYTPCMLFTRSIQFLRTRLLKLKNRQQYDTKFLNFHRRYTIFSQAHTVGNYNFAGLMHFSTLKLNGLTVGTQYGLHVQMILTVFEVVQYDLFSPFTRVVTLMRWLVFCVASIFAMLLDLPPNIVFMCGLYCQRFFFAILASTSVTEGNSKKTGTTHAYPNLFVIVNALGIMYGALVSHLTFVIDLLRASTEASEALLCSYAFHKNFFFVFGSLTFAIWNISLSPWRTVQLCGLNFKPRLLVTTIWITCDIPNLFLLLTNCSWGSNLVYGVDRMPAMARTLPIAIGGVSHLWLFAYVFSALRQCAARWGTHTRPGNNNAS